MGFGSLFKKEDFSAAGGGGGINGESSRNNYSVSQSQVEELVTIGFQKILRKWRWGASYCQSPTEEDLMKMVRVVDKDGDGFINLYEFIKLNPKDVASDEALQSLKEVFDMDGNGSIAAEELHEVLRGLGEECSVAECRKMIRGVDVDVDGMISFDEFKILTDKGSRLLSASLLFFAFAICLLACLLLLVTKQRCKVVT